jgi:hypothetical protein
MMAVDGKKEETLSYNHTDYHIAMQLMTLWASALRRGWLRRRDKKRD